MARRNPLPRVIDPLTGPLTLVPTHEPGRTAVILRPIGYLLIAVVWVVLFAAVLGVTVIALPAALHDSTAHGGLQAYPGFHRDDTWVAFIAIPMVMAVLGTISYLLILASLGNMLAALTLAARALRPSFRHEKLSISIRAAGGEAIGPASTAATGVSLSLLPVRLTRWTKIVMIVQFNGWLPNGSMFAIGSLWGALYIFTVGWVLWPATGIPLILCAVGSGVLAVGIVALIWRRRATFPAVMPSELENTAYRWSWPNKKPTAPTR